MAIMLKLGAHKESDRKIRINIMSAKENKRGWPAFINEVKGDQELPAHMVTIFKNIHGNDTWFAINGPVREVSENGECITQPRKNDANDFIDEKGQVVSTEDDAARQYVYQKDKNGKVIYATFGNINIKNTKISGEPTAQTMATLKIWNDEEAKNIEREVRKFSGASENERLIIKESLNEMRKKTGQYITMYINHGGQFLIDKGFEVRLPEEL